MEKLALSKGLRGGVHSRHVAPSGRVMCRKSAGGKREASPRRVVARRMPRLITSRATCYAGETGSCGTSWAGGVPPSTAVEGAVNLGWKLAAVTTSRASPRLLDTYDAAR